MVLRKTKIELEGDIEMDFTVKCPKCGKPLYPRDPYYLPEKNEFRAYAWHDYDESECEFVDGKKRIVHNTYFVIKPILQQVVVDEKGKFRDINYELIKKEAEKSE